MLVLEKSTKGVCDTTTKLRHCAEKNLSYDYSNPNQIFTTSQKSVDVKKNSGNLQVRERR